MSSEQFTSHQQLAPPSLLSSSAYAVATAGAPQSPGNSSLLSCGGTGGAGTGDSSCGLGMFPPPVLSSMVPPIFQRRQPQQQEQQRPQSQQQQSASTNASSAPVSNNSNGGRRTNNETDALLAMEFNQLSLAARERVLEEVHGISHEIATETTEFIEEKLAQFESEIKNIKERWYYDRAHFLCPSRVRNKNFRLMFLRSDDYNPRSAARRIVQHFAYKAELFGK